jgi:hypothetical protein
MKTKPPLHYAVLMITGLLASLLVSCTSTGNIMPLSPGETVIGMIQASFAARNAMNNSRDAINTLAYIKLLEAALKKYGVDTQIDIRDVTWTSGKDIDSGINKEYAAIGTVILFK